MKKQLLAMLAAVVATATSANAAGLKITEWMYTGLYGEFVEITNTNPANGASIDVAGYRYSDSGGYGASIQLFPTGTPVLLAPGESIIVTEANEGIFRTAWFDLPGVTAPSGLRIIDEVTLNLGRSDAINIYDSVGNLVAQLTYNDQSNPPGGPRTEDVSGVAKTPSTISAISVGNQWELSTVDPDPVAWKAGSPAANGSTGSPGYYTSTP